MTSPSAPSPPSRSRWLRRAALGCVALALGLGATVIVLVRSLDRPWLKTRLQAAIRARVGADVDWGETHVRPLAGLHIGDLVVRTPERLRAIAPELVRAAAVEVAWSPAALVGGGPVVKALTLRDLALTVVREADGKTSLSALVAAVPSTPATPTVTPPAPPSPPSRLLGELLAGAPPVGRVEVAPAALTLVLLDEGGAAETLRSDGLQLAARLGRAGAAWTVDAELGSRAAPLMVTLTRQRGRAAAGSARARVAAQLRAAPSGATLALDVAVIEQTLAPALRLRRALHLEAEARPLAGALAITVAHGEIADGAASLDADVLLPDAGAAEVRHASGTLDLPRVLAPVPASLVPLTVARARLDYRVERLLLARRPRLGTDGRVTLAGEWGGVRAVIAGNTLTADRGRLTLEARPGSDGAIDVHARLPLGLVRLARRDLALGGDGLALGFDGRLDGDGGVSGEARLAATALRLGGGVRLEARDATLHLRALALHVDPAAPLASRGALVLDAAAATLAAARAHARVAAAGLRARVDAKLTGHAPYAVDAELPIGHVRLDAGGRRLADGSARLELHGRDLVPDAAQPLRSRGRLRLGAALGPLAATLTAIKAADAVDFTLGADARSLAPLALLVPASPAWEVAWERTGLELTSSGRVEALATAPRLRHQTTLRLAHPAVRARGHAFGAAAVELRAASRGDGERHDGNADLEVRELVLRDARLGDGHFGATFAFDRARPSLRLRLGADGAGGPHGAIDAAFGFDRGRRAVTYELDGRLAGMAPLAPLAAAAGLGDIDVTRLDVGVKGRGALLGLVDAVARDGHPRLAPAPLSTLVAVGDLDVRAAGLHWTHGDQALSVPHAHWQATLGGDRAGRTVHASLDVDELHLAAGDNEVDLAGVSHQLDAVVAGDLRNPEGEVSHRLGVRVLEQDLVPEYATAGLVNTLKARRGRDGVVHISELRVDNPAAGTALDLVGGIDLGGARRSLALRGELRQDLARVWSERREFVGRGTAAVSLRLSTGNFRLLHAVAALRLQGADLRLPSAGYAVESFDGEIPVTADLVLGKRGLDLVRSSEVNAYSQLRFVDQHPLLRSHSYVAVARVVTPFVTVAPLAGNLRVDHNVVSLSQLEMGLRGGRVTGQCIFDWKEAEDATVQLHVRASRVQSSHKEPFDGNAAVVLSTRERSVEGRADILRIGKRHLLDLLDLHDPHRADPAVNRIRRALALGYPDQVRLAFNHGFANVRVTFGGLARLIHVDELRGIPMGPIIDKVLAPLSKREDDP